MVLRGAWVRRASAVVLLAALALSAAACSGDDGGDDAGGAGGDDGAASTATTARIGPPDRLYVLITNTEGIASPGLDAVAQAVYQLPKTIIAVVAPDTAAPVPAAPPAAGDVPSATFAPTLSGFPGIVVEADGAGTVQSAVAAELTGLPADQPTPDLVIAGINTGQLIGPLAEFSTNVPAAQAAADAGVPALVVAQGVDESPPEYPAGVAQVVAWIGDHRDALLAGDEPDQVTLLNVPSCAAGAVRGVVEVPVAADDAGRDLAVVDCTSTAEDPADDVAAFTTGYATLSVLPPPGATTDPSPSTTAAPGATGATGSTVAPG